MKFDADTPLDSYSLAAMARTEDIIKTSNIINLNLIIKRVIQEILDKKIISSV